MQNKVVGVIGYGSFGRLLVTHLIKHVNVFVYDPKLDATSTLPKNCSYTNLKNLAKNSDLVILAMNLDQFESVLKIISPHLKQKSIVVDVCSVKVKPVELMKKYLPESVQILGTHPLFGPQSVTEESESLSGHTIVLCPIRIHGINLLKHFLQIKFKLNVVEISPEAHDEQMSIIHGLTFFIARSLVHMNLPQEGLITPSYRHLLELAKIESTHTKALFITIEQGNPFVAEVREKFINELSKLHKESL
jgi:prephenate dehydrogenase